MENVNFLDRVKIWTEILLPFYQRVREELGEERAAELLRAAVDEYSTGLGNQVSKSASGTSLDKLRTLVPSFAAGDALDIEPIANDDKEFSMNIRGCRYAEYFKSLGEPKFGAMITCECDPPLTAGIGPDLKMERTQTIAGGGTHCDFKWTLRSE